MPRADDSDRPDRPHRAAGARRAAGPRRRRADRTAAAAARGRGGRAAGGCGVDVKSIADRRGHRGGPGLRAVAGRRAGPAAAGRRAARRGGRGPGRRQRRALGGGPHRRHGELPLRPAPVRGVGARPSGTGEWSPAPCTTRPRGRRSAARAGRRGVPGRRRGSAAAGSRAGLDTARGRDRLRVRRRPARRAGRGAGRRCCPGSATCAGSVRPRWTSATWPPAGWTATTSTG